MFVEFSVENYRSIRERVVLSMVAASLKSQDENLDRDNVITIDSKLSLLRSAVIYGANASGKSNILNAFSIMRMFVGDSANGQAEDSIPVEPFFFDYSTFEEPSIFEVVFLLNGIQYRYGFSANSDRVVTEWLYRTKSSREATLFTRDESGIKISNYFSEGKGLDSRTRDNALFLSVVAQFNGEIATKIRNWFVITCRTITGLNDSGYLPYTMRCIQDDEKRSQIEGLVSQLDLDIQSLQVEVDEIEDGNKSISEQSSRANATHIQSEKKKRMRLNTVHSIRDQEGNPSGQTLIMNMNHSESEGTKKLIALAGPLVHVLSEGLVLFVDEMDARLHPLITSALIKLFHSEQTNPKKAQLICVTQDTNLLDRHIFRRDQIYFVEKNKVRASKLYSLAEFKIETDSETRAVRNDASFEREYIQGRYGAIPYLGDIGKLISTSNAKEDPDNIPDEKSKPKKLIAK